MIAIAALALVAVLGPVASAQATQQVFPRPGFDMDVRAVTKPDSAGRVIVGGDFEHYGGWFTGGGAMLQPGSNDPNTAFPAIHGVVSASVPDGAGGMYIGGTYLSCVGGDPSVDDCAASGGTAVQNFAHIKPDGTIDLDWLPQTGSLGDSVQAMVKVGSDIWVGGTFASVNGMTYQGLLRLDAATGAVETWDADLYDDGVSTPVVYALLTDGTTVYVGGRFTAVDGSGGIPRAGLAAFDAATGNLISGWDPGLTCDPALCVGTSLSVQTLAFGDGPLYIGGRFDHVGGTARLRFAAVDANPTGTGALISSFQADMDYPPTGLVAVGTKVYVAGGFTSIGGASRSNLAAVNGATGAVDGWNPDPDQAVNRLVLDGTTLYAAGDFTTLEGGLSHRSRLASFDTTSGSLTSWNPSADASVSSLVATGDSTGLYAGGYFQTIGATQRRHLAQFDNTGALTSWNPDVDGTVYDIAVRGSTAYVAGNFARVNDGALTRTNLAAFDTSTGAATAWNPGFGCPSTAIAVDGVNVFVGYTSCPGGITAFDLSGAASSWAGAVDSDVKDIVVANGVVYAGGSFASATGPSGTRMRASLAAFDDGAGDVTDWNPRASDVVWTLALHDGAIYAGGGFSCVGGDLDCGGSGTGTVRNLAAAFDTAGTGAVRPWNPDVETSGLGYFTEEVSSIAVAGSDVYLGGVFREVNEGRGPVAAHAIAKVAADTGDADGAWISSSEDGSGNPVPVWAIAYGGGALFAGGAFTHINAVGRQHFSAVSAATGAAVSSWSLPTPPPTGVAATAGDASATVRWTAAAGATGYTVTAHPGGASCTTAGTTCDVTGLANGVAYVFTVVATGTGGDSEQSDPSDSITPSAAPGPTPKPSGGKAVVPSSVVRAGLRANPRGGVLLPLRCTATSGVCRASVTLSISASALARTDALRVIARSGALRIRAGKRIAVRLRISPSVYAQLHANGITRVRATLRVTNRTADGTTVTTTRTWLRVAPRPTPVPVTG